MGGRGGFSYGGDFVPFDIGKNDGVPEGLLPQDTRENVRDWADQAGFARVMGTTGIDEDVMRASLARLTQLEQRFHALRDSEGDMVLTGVPMNDAMAYVTNNVMNGRDQQLVFSSKFMGDGDELYDMTKYAIGKGHFMPTSADRQTVLGYTATHEYGHMVENILSTRARANGESQHAYALRVRDEVLSMAGLRYNSSEYKRLMSQYGKSNAYEFFAEAFANAYSGKPNRIGRAMDQWLIRQGYY